MSYLVRRAIALLITLWLVSLITFALLQVIPGDPAQLILGTEAPPEALEELRCRLGLDQPPLIRYVNWLGGVLRGRWGQSIRHERPVMDLIRERLPVTLSLTALAAFFALVVSIPLGVMAAVRRGSALDYAVLLLTQAGLAIPSFWAGTLLILLFALAWHWFPTGGYVPWGQDRWQALRHLALPALALGTAMSAALTRMTRSSMIEALHQDYVRTARAKGLPERAVLYRHALRNALIPTVTLLGVQLSFLLGGSIVIEEVFALPGLGRLLLSAIYTRDLPLIQGLVLFITTGVVGASFLVDVAYACLDPRISLE